MSSEQQAEKTGPELVAEVAADPTIDRMMRADPKTVTDEDLLALIGALRTKRAMFIREDEKKRMKKAGVQVDEVRDDAQADS